MLFSRSRRKIHLQTRPRRIIRSWKANVASNVSFDTAILFDVRSTAHKSRVLARSPSSVWQLLRCYVAVPCWNKVPLVLQSWPIQKPSTPTSMHAVSLVSGETQARIAYVYESTCPFCACVCACARQVRARSSYRRGGFNGTTLVCRRTDKNRIRVRNETLSRVDDAPSMTFADRYLEELYSGTSGSYIARRFRVR